MIEKLLYVAVDKKKEALHWHDSMEIYFILKGTAHGTVNNHEISLKAGDLWIVNRDMVHGLQNCADDLIFIQLRMNMEEFNQYIPDIWTVYFGCGPQENDNVSETLKREIKAHICTIVNLMEYETGYTESEKEILSSCIEILNTLKLGFNMIGKRPEDYKDKERFNRIWRVTDFIYDHCNRKLALKEVAAQEYISEAYLSKLLKDETGKNFEETVAFVRAECSIKYLLSSEMSITDIAYECGFSAPRYYNAAFLKYYHCSPAEYRKKAKSAAYQDQKISTTSVVFHPEVDRSDIVPLLNKYNENVALLWETSRIPVNLDIIDGMMNRSSARCQCNTLICTSEEILLPKNRKLIQSCRDELRLSRVCLTGGENQALEALAKETIKELELDVVDLVKNGLRLSQLFWSNGAKTEAFYKWYIYNHIEGPAALIKNSLLIWRSRSGIHLLLFNEKKNSHIKCLIEFRGVKADEPYIVREENFCPLPGQQAAFVQKKAASIGPEQLQLLSEPNVQTNIVESLVPITFKKILSEKQLCKIDLYGITDKT